MRLMLFIPLMLAGEAALASTDEAWTEFRADVLEKCRALAPEGGASSVEVNPLGSDRFGAAIVTTTLESGETQRAICIYDKQAKTAEITAPFGG